VSPSEFSEVRHVAALGGGLIGRSWTALFLAAGRSVAVFDPDPATERRVRDTVTSAWPVLQRLGLTLTSEPEAGLVICDDPRAAVDGAQFVQESIPERVASKHDLYATIEPVLADDVVVASSASGLTLSELQGGWSDPSRLVLGHPFNPPHLIPLVEVMGNERTAPGVVAAARLFYESVGKVTIEVKREVPGHVANRLQAALWREGSIWSTQAWPPSTTSTPPSPPGPGYGGRSWGRRCCSTWAATTAGSPPSASGTPTAFTAGGTTSAPHGWTTPPSPAWSRASAPTLARASMRLLRCGTPAWPLWLPPLTAVDLQPRAQPARSGAGTSVDVE
jgi:hypothetical protein